eukprot:5449_1
MSLNRQLNEELPSSIQEEEKEEEDEDEKENEKIELNCDDIFWVKASGDIQSYDVYIYHEKTVGKGKRIFLQEMQTERFDIDEAMNQKLSLPLVYCAEKFYCELLDEKESLHDINDLRRILNEEKYGLNYICKEFPLNKSSHSSIKTKLKSFDDKSKVTNLQRMFGKLTKQIQQKWEEVQKEQSHFHIYDMKAMMIICDSKNILTEVMDEKQKLDGKNDTIENEYKKQKQRQQAIRDLELKQIQQVYEERVRQIEKDTKALIEYRNDREPFFNEYTQKINAVNNIYNTQKQQIEKNTKQHINKCNNANRQYIKALKKAAEEKSKIMKIMTKYYNSCEEEVNKSIENDNRTKEDYIKGVKKAASKFKKRLKSINSKHIAFKSDIEKLMQEQMKAKLLIQKQDAIAKNKYSKMCEKAKNEKRETLAKIKKEYRNETELIKNKYKSWHHLAPEVANLLRISNCNENQIQFIVLYNLKFDELMQYGPFIEQFLQYNNINGGKLFKDHTNKSLKELLSESFRSQQSDKPFRSNKNQLPDIFGKLYTYKSHKNQISIEEEKQLLNKIKSMKSIARCNRREILYILDTKIINLKTPENQRKISQFFVSNQINGNKLKSIPKQQFLSDLRKQYKYKFEKAYEKLISFHYNANQQSIQDAKKEEQIRALESIANCDEEQILFVVKNAIKSTYNTSLDKNEEIIVNNVFKKYKMTGYKLSTFSREDFQDLLGREVYNGKNKGTHAIGQLYDQLMQSQLSSTQNTLLSERNQNQFHYVEVKGRIVELIDEFKWDVTKNDVSSSWYSLSSASLTKECTTDKGISFTASIKESKFKQQKNKFELTFNFDKKSQSLPNFNNILFDLECITGNSTSTERKKQPNTPIFWFPTNTDKWSASTMQFKIKSRTTMLLTKKEIIAQIKSMKIHELSKYSECTSQQIEFIFSTLICNSLQEEIEDYDKKQMIKFFQNQKISGNSILTWKLYEFQNSASTAVSGKRKLLKEIWHALRNYKYYQYQISINDEASENGNSNDDDEKKEENNMRKNQRGNTSTGTGYKTPYKTTSKQSSNKSNEAKYGDNRNNNNRQPHMYDNNNNNSRRGKGRDKKNRKGISANQVSGWD